MKPELDNHLNPLHRAIIEGDKEAFEKECENKEWLKQQDFFGFTPLELAQLLGHRYVQKKLGSASVEGLKVQRKGEKSPSLLPLHEAEFFFNIIYRSFLTFPNYDFLALAIANCPYLLRNKWLAKENHELTLRHKNKLATGMTAKVYIKWIDSILGYGLFADEEIRPETWIGEYTGLVSQSVQNENSSYCFSYPTKLWAYNFKSCVDSQKEGNLTRFINHSDTPNAQPICLIEKGVLHQVFIADRLIKKDTQITFDYGQDYWKKRKKITIN